MTPRVGDRRNSLQIAVRGPLTIFVAFATRAASKAMRWAGATLDAFEHGSKATIADHSRPYAESKKTFQCKDFLQYLTSIDNSSP
jgi:hypothetical protein